MNDEFSMKMVSKMVLLPGQKKKFKFYNVRQMKFLPKNLILRKKSVKRNLQLNIVEN